MTPPAPIDLAGVAAKFVRGPWGKDGANLDAFSFVVVDGDAPHRGGLGARGSTTAPCASAWSSSPRAPTSWSWIPSATRASTTSCRSFRSRTTRACSSRSSTPPATSRTPVIDGTDVYTPIRDVEWIANLGNKVAGSLLENPHVLSSVSRLRGPVDAAAVELATPADVFGTDGNVATSVFRHRWRQLKDFNDDAPLPRINAGLVFDAARARLVMHGGGFSPGAPFDPAAVVFRRRRLGRDPDASPVRPARRRLHRLRSRARPRRVLRRPLGLTHPRRRRRARRHDAVDAHAHGRPWPAHQLGVRVRRAPRRHHRVHGRQLDGLARRRLAPRRRRLDAARRRRAGAVHGGRGHRDRRGARPRDPRRAQRGLERVRRHHVDLR